MAAGTLSIIGTVVSAVGGVVGTMAQMQAASYQAAVAERNAQIMEQNARREVDRAQVETQDQSELAREQIGQVIAAQSASGISLQSGSPLVRRRGLQRLAERDAVRIRSDANVQAERFQQQSADYQGQAGMARSRGRMSLFSGVLNVGSTLIGGARQHQQIRSMS